LQYNSSSPDTYSWGHCFLSTPAAILADDRLFFNAGIPATSSSIPDGIYKVPMMEAALVTDYLSKGFWVNKSTEEPASYRPSNKKFSGYDYLMCVMECVKEMKLNGYCAEFGVFSNDCFL
jgi:hypothetical protein